MAACRSVFDINKEERDVHAERLGNVIEPGCRYAVAAALIFLDLLKRHTHRIRNLLLRHSHQISAKPQALAYMHINGVRAINLNAPRRLAPAN